MESEAKRTKVQPTGKRGGVWVPIGDEEYRIPPLGFRAVQDVEADIEGLTRVGARPTPEQMGTIAKIVRAAIARNYPEVTEDDVLDMLDFGNYQDVLAAVLAVAGFKEATDGKGEV